MIACVIGVALVTSHLFSLNTTRAIISPSSSEAADYDPIDPLLEHNQGGDDPYNEYYQQVMQYIKEHSTGRGRGSSVTLTLSGNGNLEGGSEHVVLGRSGSEAQHKDTIREAADGTEWNEDKHSRRLNIFAFNRNDETDLEGSNVIEQNEQVAIPVYLSDLDEAKATELDEAESFDEGDEDSEEDESSEDNYEDDESAEDDDEDSSSEEEDEDGDLSEESDGEDVLSEENDEDESANETEPAEEDTEDADEENESSADDDEDESSAEDESSEENDGEDVLSEENDEGELSEEDESSYEDDDGEDESSEDDDEEDESSEEDDDENDLSGENGEEDESIEEDGEEDGSSEDDGEVDGSSEEDNEEDEEDNRRMITSGSFSVSNANAIPIALVVDGADQKGSMEEDAQVATSVSMGDAKVVKVIVLEEDESEAEESVEDPHMVQQAIIWD